MLLRKKQPEQSIKVLALEQIDEPPAKSYAIDFNDFSGQKSQKSENLKVRELTLSL